MCTMLNVHMYTSTILNARVNMGTILNVRVYTSTIISVCMYINTILNVRLRAWGVFVFNLHICQDRELVVLHCEMFNYRGNL